MKAANESLRTYPENTVNKKLKSAAILLLSAGIHAAILSVGNGFSKDTTTTNNAVASETTESKLEKYRRLYPALKELPDIEQRAVIELYEEDVTIVEERKKKRKVDPDKANSFRAEMANAIATNQLPKWKTYFERQEKEVLGVDEKTVAEGIAYFEQLIAEIQNKPDLDDLAKIQEFIKIFQFKEATDDTANSVFDCLVSIKEGRKPECNCKGRMKLTLMGLQELLADKFQGIDFQDSALHTRFLFQLGNETMAIEGSNIVPAGNLAGTIVSKPVALIHRLLGNSKETVVPGNYEPGKKYPVITDDDQHNLSAKVALKSINPGIRSLYPGLDERVRLLAGADENFEVQLFEPETISAEKYAEIMSGLESWEQDQSGQVFDVHLDLLIPSPKVIDQLRSIYDRVDEIKSKHPDRDKHMYTQLDNVTHYDKDTLKKLLTTKPQRTNHIMYSVDGLSSGLNNVLAEMDMVRGSTHIMVHCWNNRRCNEELTVDYFRITGSRGTFVIQGDFQLTDSMKQAIRGNTNLEVAPTTIKYLYKPAHTPDTVDERVQFEVVFET